MNKYKKLVGDSLIFAVGNLGSKIVQFILVPLYSFALTTSEFGRADLLTQLVYLLAPIIGLNLFDAAFRFSLDKNENKKVIFSTTFLVLASISFIILILSSLLNPFSHNYPLFDAACFLICYLFFTFFSNFIRAIGYIKEFAIAGIINTFFMGIASIIFLLGMKLGVTGYILAFSLGLMSAIVYIFISTKIYSYLDLHLFNYLKLKEMLKYSLPLVPNSLAWWLNSSSDRLFIIIFLGASANWIYAMAGKIPNLINVLINVFFQSWQISIVEEYKNKDSKSFVSNVFNSFISILMIAAMLIVTFIKPIFYFLLDKSYYSGWLLTPLLVLAVVYSGVSVLLEAVYTAYKNTMRVFSTTLYGAVINIILTLVLLNVIGYYGAAIANIISFGLVAILRIKDIVHKEILKVNYKKIIIYHLLFLFTSIIPLVIHNMLISISLGIIIIISIIGVDADIRKQFKRLF